MPLQSDPSRRYLRAVLRVQSREFAVPRGGNAFNGITEEVITAVAGGGFYEVAGRKLTTMGTSGPLKAGDVVNVGWRGGIPILILYHTNRRVKGVANVAPANPVVEELFVAQRPDGVTDVYFRNYDQTVPLEISRFGIANPSTVKWGPANDRFFIQVGTKYHVMKFDRDPFTPFTPGTDAARAISLERIEDLSANDMVLASLTYPTPSTIKANGAGANRTSVSLATDGSLIGAFEVTVQGAISVPGSIPAPNFDSSLLDATTSSTFQDTMSWPVIADLTNRVVLLSGFDTPALLAPFTTLFDWNGAARITQNIVDNHGPVTGFPRAVTWVGSNSFTTPIDPPFEGNTSIVSTWQFGFSQDPSGIRCQAEPIFVLGKDVAAALRVRGFVAWVRLRYNVFLGQTFDVANWHRYFPFSGQTGWFPVSPAAPFPVTEQSGAAARSPQTGVLVTLYAIARPSAGLSYAPTWDRVVWRKPTSVTFFTADGGLNQGGADTPGFSTLFANGIAQQLTTGLRAALGQHGVNVLPADYAYQLDNPATALPAAADRNYFVSAWGFQGGVPGDIVAAGYPEDSALSDLKTMEDIPAGVTQPTALGSFALQVVNSDESLSAAGEFEDAPAPPTP